MKDTSEGDADQGWIWATAVAKDQVKDRAIIFRYVKEFPADFDRSKQPDRVIIVWKFESDSGMPDTSENERMGELEDLLKPAIEAEGFATLAIVSTGEGLREWTYYTVSVVDFLSRLNEVLRFRPRYPVEIYVAPDTHWTTYEEFRAGLQE